jgi:hypothetical protein
LLIESQQALFKSFYQAGFPISEATKNFERLLNGYADMYKNALDNMERIWRVCTVTSSAVSRDVPVDTVPNPPAVRG